MDALLTFLQTPLGAAVVLAAAFILPKVAPTIGPFVAPLLKIIAPKLPTPAPLPIPIPHASTAAPDFAVEVLKQIALKRFPWASPEAAVTRFAQSQIEEIEAKERAKAEAAVKASTS